MSIDRRYFYPEELAGDYAEDLQVSLSFSRLLSLPLRQVKELQERLDRANETIRNADIYAGELFTEFTSVRSNCWHAERQIKELKEDNIRMNSKNSELRVEMERMSKRIIELNEELAAIEVAKHLDESLDKKKKKSKHK